MKVIIVDDDQLIRESLSMMLGTFEDIEVLGSFENGLLALEYLESNQVDLMLLDIRMPVMNGVELTKAIHNSEIKVKILVLTTFTDSEFIYDAINHGADGYILKSRGIHEIYQSIQSVMMGQVVLDTTIKQAIIQPVKKKAEPISELTDKEMSILKCIGEGLNNKEISAQLFLSEGTIRNYISQLLIKLDMRDRTQLAIYYLKVYG